MEELYRAHATAVRSYLLGLCRDPHHADDLMQDTFVRATRAMGGYRGGSPRSWLLAIARTTFLDDVRRKRPFPVADIPDVAATDPDLPERAVILAALARLPEAQASALILRDQLDLPYAEVAEALGRKLGATKVLIHRARAAFRRAYEAEGGHA